MAAGGYKYFDLMAVDWINNDSLPAGLPWRLISSPKFFLVA